LLACFSAFFTLFEDCLALLESAEVGIGVGLPHQRNQATGGSSRTTPPLHTHPGASSMPSSRARSATGSGWRAQTTRAVVSRLSGPVDVRAALGMEDVEMVNRERWSRAVDEAVAVGVGIREAGRDRGR